MPKETFFNLPDDKRQRIVAIAMDEFADNDYQNASVSRMVAAAGIAKGSFYQYFDDKRDLYLYLLDLGAQEKAKLLAQAPPDPAMGIFDYLLWLVEATLKFEFAYPRLSEISYRALKGGGLPDETLADAKQMSQQYFGALVQKGIASGEIDPEIDPALAAFMFHAIFMELGTYLIERFEFQPEGNDGDVQRLFGSPEVQATYAQALWILQHGMGKS